MNITPRRVAASVALVAFIGVGAACSSDKADKADTKTSDTVETPEVTIPEIETPMPSDEDINAMSFDIVWDSMTQADRDLVCEGTELYGFDYAGQLVSEGSSGTVSPEQATDLLEGAC